MCETLSRVLGVPFVTADATSLAQTRYVNEEIEAMLQRLVDKADGDVATRRTRHRLHRRDRQAQGARRAGAQHLRRERAARAAQDHGRRTGQAGATGAISTRRNILFICGGAFVGLDEIMSQTHGYGFISMSDDDNQNILDRLNSRVKPTDLFKFGLIPEFTGRLPIIARFQDLTRTDAGADHDRAEELDLQPVPRNFQQRRRRARRSSRDVFEQIAEIAIEYKTGARSLRGIFEELMTPILYDVPDRDDVVKVEITSLFREPAFVTGRRS